MLSYATGYGLGSGAVVKGATKVLPQINNLSKFGQRVAKGVATDIAIGLPMNINSAINKEKLRGKEALKNVTLNTVLDLGVGIGIEGLARISIPTLPRIAQPHLPYVNEKTFMKQIEDMFHGKFRNHEEVIEFGDTPAILLQHGANPLKLTATQKSIRKIVYPYGYMGGKHNLGFEALENLPECLAEPIAILKSDSQENSLVIITNMLDRQNNPVIVAVHLDKMGRFGITNSIPSMYGKLGYENFIRTQTEKGNLIYKNEEVDLVNILNFGKRLTDTSNLADPMIRQLYEKGINK